MGVILVLLASLQHPVSLMKKATCI
uniref:Uncharacterized protein n=1 Tax=Vitis vinifera TaxID=29760 RepID=F6I2G2_VITVI